MDEVDFDGDGVMLCDGDCDDSDPDNFPGNPEVCDDEDNDCDGAPGPAEIDDDGDGVDECDVPEDCDDEDPLRFPGNPEVCDGLDNDCDAVVGVDEVDFDGDGVMLCDGDCDDSDPDNFPGNPEACDGQDNDCSGQPLTDLWGPPTPNQTFSGSQLQRGNLARAYQPNIVVGLQAELAVPVGDDVTFTLYQSYPTPYGPFVELASSTITSTTPSMTTHSSGPMSVLMVPGRWYAATYHFAGTAYYRRYTGSNPPSTARGYFYSSVGLDNTPVPSSAIGNGSYLYGIDFLLSDEVDLDSDSDLTCTDCNDTDPSLNWLDSDGDGEESCDEDCDDSADWINTASPDNPWTLAVREDCGAAGALSFASTPALEPVVSYDVCADTAPVFHAGFEGLVDDDPLPFGMSVVSYVVPDPSDWVYETVYDDGGVDDELPETWASGSTSLASPGLDVYVPSVDDLCREIALDGLSVGSTYMVAVVVLSDLDLPYQLFMYLDDTTTGLFLDPAVQDGENLQLRGFFTATTTSHVVFACSGGDYSGASAGSTFNEDEWTVIEAVPVGSCP